MTRLAGVLLGVLIALVLAVAVPALSSDFLSPVGDYTESGLPLSGGTLTGVLLVPSGDSTDPSIAHSGDSDTGIYFGANQINLSTGSGSGRLLLTNGGVVLYDPLNSLNQYMYDSGGMFELGGDMSNGSHDLGTGDVGIAGDLEVDGTAWFDSTLNVSGGVDVGTFVSVASTATYFWKTRSRMYSPVDGNIELTQQDGAGFGSLILGHIAAAQPAGDASDVTVTSSAHTNAADYDSGDLTIASGATTTDGDTGDVILRSGAAGAGAADAGDILLQTHGANTRLTVAGNGAITIAPANSVTAITGEVNVSGVTGSGKVVCVKADGNFGVCNSIVGGGGTCTCI